MDNGALLVIEEQELVKKTVKFIKTGENACEKCYFHDHGHCPLDCDDGYYVEYNPSLWQTGKPEEEGQYLVYCDDGIGADVDDFLNGEWHFYGDHVKAWKKIYVPLWLLEEKEDGR